MARILSPAEWNRKAEKHKKYESNPRQNKVIGEVKRGVFESLEADEQKKDCEHIKKQATQRAGIEQVFS